MKKGKLEVYFETGMEGVEWSFYEDGKKGYDGLNTLTEEHRLKIFDENDNLIFDEEIIKDRFSNYGFYKFNPIYGQPHAGGFSCHWTQPFISPTEWAEMFSKQLRAELHPSRMSKEKKEKIKEKIIEEYHKTKDLTEVITTKSIIPYEEKKELEIGQKIILANKSYQYFEDIYYTGILLDMYDSESLEIDVRKDTLDKEDFYEISFKNKNVLDHIRKYLENEKAKDYSEHFKIYFKDKEDITEEEFKYIEKEEKLKKEYEEALSKLTVFILNEISELPIYQVGKQKMKLIKFNKEISEIIKK